ncbi:hypothetical protein VKT23_016341 [Stygiomarasmius scandens]|uniref:Uncharacterized protein n=1 Tax=Marasmiellus scandens TaxID=2682957 RepID=A0ABR1IVA1_9AGAR
MLVISRSSSKFRHVNANANTNTDNYSVSISISGTNTGTGDTGSGHHVQGSVPTMTTTLVGKKKQGDSLGSGVDGEGRFDMKESRLESLPQPVPDSDLGIRTITTAAIIQLV